MKSNKDYLELRDKLDQKWQELQKDAGEHFQCQKGCYSCCLPGLSVSPVERDTILDYLRAHPEAVQALSDQATHPPFADQRCSLLDGKGSCLIYPARPLICRSHGAPIKFNEQDNLRRDVCPLNFKALALEEIPEELVLNLDLINTLLTLINIRIYGQKRSGERTALAASDLLGLLDRDDRS